MKGHPIRIGLFAAIVILGLDASASAQTKACVYLEPGAGYAAKMRVKWGTNSQTDWSGKFAIGKYGCVDLSSIATGTPYTVEVQALAGRTKSCTPTNEVKVDGNFNIVYNAWGTTGNVKCKMLGST